MMFKFNVVLSLMCIGFMFLCSQALAGENGVRIVRGSTPILNGDAQASSDLTLANSKLAVAFAVETGAPWGVARGGILDGAVVNENGIQLDKVTLIDFIPNNWSSWPNTYHEVKVLKDTPQEGVIQTKRDWGQCDLVTTYTLNKGSDRVRMVTTMTNNGDKPEKDILSGYVLWCTGGSHFGPAGLAGRKEGSRQGTMSDWSVTYDRDWAITIHAPYFDHFDYDGRDLYLKHTLRPGETRTFKGWLQITASGDLSPIMQAEIERKDLPAGKVQGTITTRDGEPVDTPYVLVRKNEQTYTWARGNDGQFSMQLPAGSYELYATAQGYAPAKAQKVVVEQDTQSGLSFNDLRNPGQVSFNVFESQTKLPLDARISISKGVQPVIGFMGQKIFFTELQNKGNCQVKLAPGDYTFQVQSGAPFISQAREVDLTVPSNSKVSTKVEVSPVARPKDKKWYGVDLHHHSDQLDGKTSPELLVRSQLAAGLDFIFLSDHDTTVNHKTIRSLAGKRGVPFIPGIEISPSWGHFNAYPLQLGLPWTVDTSNADVHTLFEAARELGTELIGVNHPFIKYGYFYNLDQNSTKGGFNPRFNLIELNGNVDYEQALHMAWSLWNKGWDTYLQAGTDAHDIMLEDEISGSMRMMVHIQGAPTVNNLIAGLKAGNGYATTGPLLYPNGPLFGETLVVKKGENISLPFEAVAAQGLAKIDLIRQGEVVETVEFDKALQRQDFAFDLTVQEDTWVALVVKDKDENTAYTNPIWLDVRDYSPNAE